jgi:hypothetical protein
MLQCFTTQTTVRRTSGGEVAPGSDDQLEVDVWRGFGADVAPVVAGSSPVALAIKAAIPTRDRGFLFDHPSGQTFGGLATSLRRHAPIL